MRHSSVFFLTLLVLGCDGRPVFTPAAWVRVQAGSFMMGSPPSENCRESGQFKETQHKVTLTRSFEISDSETTQGQFEDELGYNPSEFVECGSDCPVEKVTWNEAVQYCNALSKAKKLIECYTCQGTDCDVAATFEGSKIYTCPGFRLPTEAEWEYATRAGTTSAFYNGLIISCEGFDSSASAIGWFFANSGMTIQTVKQKTPNAWKLYDMSGSVWEWVHDWFEPDLGATPVVDPAGPAVPTIGRALRGGSCQVKPQFLRSASRWNYQPPGTRLKLHGFRCVRTVK